MTAHGTGTTAATWEERFRAPRTLWVRIAGRRPDRGLVCTNRSGTYQIHRWVVGEPPGESLTSNPEGRSSAWISPDGAWVAWHADVAGNELGHFVAVPWDGGDAIDLTPDLPDYASFSADFGEDGTFVASIVGNDRVQIAVIDPPDGEGRRPGPRLVDPGPGFVTGIVAGGPRIAYTTTSGRGLATSLRIIDAQSGDLVSELDHAPGAISGPRYAASGRLLAATSRSGQGRPIAIDADGGIHEYPLPAVEGELFPVSIARDGRTALVVSSHRATERLHVLDLETGALHQLEGLTGTVSPYRPGSGTFIAADGRIVVTREDATTLPEVIVVDPANGRRLETLMPAPEVPPSRPFRSVDIPTTDGATVQGWLATPGGEGSFEKGSRIPTASCRRAARTAAT